MNQSLQKDRLYAPGISVIIPTFQGLDRLPSLLESVEAQSLSTENFEIVFVINGPDDKTGDYLIQIRKERPELVLRIVRSLKSGASVARNIGLATATREFVTFVDDDDFIEPDFLKDLLEASSLRHIALAPMCDRLETSGELQNSTLSQRIQARAKKEFAIDAEPWTLGFNACKSLPTVIANQLRYDESLTSGEDVAYFAGLLTYPGLTVRALKDSGSNRYIRTIREQSVSRKSESFQFDVSDRLACIASIQRHLTSGKAEAAQRSLCASQFGFVQRYWDTHSEEHEAIRDAIAAAHVKWVPWEQLNKGKARQLVFSYCFPPYADTSAMVAAKLVLQQAEYVDVISADMSRVRNVDSSLLELASRWIDNRIEIQTPASFANWSLILEFAENAAKQAEKLTRARAKPYDSLYSRVMWPASHLAAYLYKQEHPDVPWTAEFSDPMRLDANAKERDCPLTSDALTCKLSAAADAENPHMDVDNGFDLIEALTLIHADEVVFTNANQRDVVLSAYGNDFAEQVRTKSVIRPQPVPTADMYSVNPPAVRLPSETVNIGYFGNFYPNRGLGEVFETLEQLGLTNSRSIHFYIFTSSVEQVQALVPEPLREMVTVSAGLPYLSFLATSAAFDVLFVGDAVTEGTFINNPFLPSKYADYRGSGARIWAHVEPGSPLSMEDVDLKSTIGNAGEIREIVEGLLTHVSSGLGQGTNE
ncbi:glycosyltransferase [Corynebacterium sp. ED61]|uniref:glycosyltransferase n=1 Tax=Corynebacterium sp. ED61 TaxID=2211360 RepID=UPI0018843E8B|nr:glycosyltransferase [Corynebacterium sp. ED61]MBF0580794.1 glycosyltransferase [Corynebacterium sp. ED61]